MYTRIVIVLICMMAGFIAAGSFAHRSRHTIPAASAPTGDAGLNRRLDRITFNGVSRRGALDWVRHEAHVSVMIEPSDQPKYDPKLDLPVTLDLKDVTVETTLRLIFGSEHDIAALGGEVAMIQDAREGYTRVFRAYDVRDLVSPPAAASVPAGPGYRSGRGRFSEDWFGVDGIHAAPRDLVLPPPEEANLATTLNAVLGYSDETRIYSGEALTPAAQLLPGCLIGSLTRATNQEVAGALEQLHHPMGLVTYIPPPERLLDRRLPALNLVSVPLDEAIERLRQAAGVNIVHLAENWNRSALVSADCTGLTLEDALVTLLNGRPHEISETMQVSESGGVIGIASERPYERTILRVYDVRSLLENHAGWLTGSPPPSTSASPASVEQQWEMESLMKLIARNVRPRGWPLDDHAWSEGRMRAWHGRLLVVHERDAQQEVWNYLHHIHETGRLPD